MTTKIGIAWIWTSPFVWTRTVDSLLQLEAPPGCELAFRQGRGWCPAARHINGCQKCIDSGCDYICILGADQVYNPDLLYRLWGRIEQGCDVISALVPARGYVGFQGMKPFQPMAWRHPHSLESQEWDRNSLEMINPADGDLQEVDYIGSGVLMFPTDLLLSLEKPWFFESINPQTQQRTACMDTKFIWRLKAEGGARVWCDTSIKIGHIHDMVVDDTFQDRFDDWMDGGGDPHICIYQEQPAPVETR